MSDADPPDDVSRGPALSADGKLEGRLARIEPEGAPPLPPPPEEPVLELAERGPKRYEPTPDSYRAPIPHPRRQLAVRLVFAAVIVGAVLLSGGLFVSKPPARGDAADTVHSTDLLEQLTAGGPKAPAIITSEPAGATVRVGGQKVGVTPWAGDNVWNGETPVELELPGYKRWKGTLRGGEEVNLNARLTK